MSVAVLAVRPLNLVGTVFLARLLDPRDFGLVALAMLVFTMMRPVVGLGMAPAVIQSKLDGKEIAFPAFLVTLLTSTSLFLAAMLNAGFLARLLGDPAVEPIVRTLSAIILLDALTLVPSALLQKGLRFGPIGTATFVARLAELGLSLVLAFLGFGVWSLVYGRIIYSLTTIAIIWGAGRGRLWLIPTRWRSEDLYGLLRYGARAMASAVASVFNGIWDSWIVGRSLGATSLGYYSKAYKLTTQTMEGISRQVVDTVFLPTYAEIQEERERLSRVYVKSTYAVTLITIPLALGTFVMAQEGVAVLLGAKWSPMVPALQVFALKTLFRPLSTSAASLFQGVGHPEYNLHAGLVFAAILVPLSLLMLRWDFTGVAVAVLVAHVIGWLYNLWQVTRILPGVVPRLLATALPGLAAGGLMMAGVQLSKQPLLRLVHGEHNLVSVGVMVILGAAIYLLASYLLQRTLLLEALQMMLVAVKGRRRAARKGAP